MHFTTLSASRAIATSLQCLPQGAAGVSTEHDRFNEVRQGGLVEQPQSRCSTSTEEGRHAHELLNERSGAALLECDDREGMSVLEDSDKGSRGGSNVLRLLAMYFEEAKMSGNAYVLFTSLSSDASLDLSPPVRCSMS